MRSKEELQKLWADVKKWFKEESGKELCAEIFQHDLYALRKEKYKQFVFKRLGHLGFADVEGFIDIFEADIKEDGKRAKASKKV